MIYLFTLRKKWKDTGEVFIHLDTTIQLKQFCFKTDEEAIKKANELLNEYDSIDVDELPSYRNVVMFLGEGI